LNGDSNLYMLVNDLILYLILWKFIRSIGPNCTDVYKYYDIWLDRSFEKFRWLYRL